MAKAMANRLKNHLHVIIDQEQSAFVPGRLITDNILIAFETLHTIRQRRAGRRGLMAIKLDMNNAFDRVEWSFLSAVMEKLGFSGFWIESRGFGMSSFTLFVPVMLTRTIQFVAEIFVEGHSSWGEMCSSGSNYHSPILCR